MYFIILSNRLIRRPDRAETSGFSGHNVYSAAVIHAQIFLAVPYKFQHLILYPAAGKHLFNKRYGYVVRPTPGLGAP